MRKTIFLSMISILLLISVANAEISSCSSGGLTTSINKQFQMAYPNENFLQISNIDLLHDVSQLKDLTCLQYLDATDRTITGDIANLKNLVNLEVFSLYSNPDVYGDICSLSGATNLRSLKFAFDPKITGNISCLKNLIKLETFAMTHTQIYGDLSVFANMPNLKAIYVSGTNLSGNICAFSELTNLEELGIADEYPGNPNIKGDLSCLDNLQKLKRVSIYNTGTTNCEQFTQSHPNISQMGPTESGRPAGGGCSEESLKTLVDVAQKYEQKIGKEVQTEVRGQPDYQPEGIIKDNKGAPPQECIVDKQFIGEEKCRALVNTERSSVSQGPPGECIVDKQFIGEEKCRALVNTERSSVSQGPPGECIIEGEFIGEDKCRALMDKTFLTQPEKTELQGIATEKNIWKKLIEWFSSLFK